MNSHSVPPPTVMPVDREAWARQLNLVNFINAFYQYRDLQSLDNCKRILILGPGQGLEKCIFDWKGYEVTTFDIDSTFNPDVIGSAHDLGVFGNKEFDVVIASHVLEHMAEPYLNPALSEISRVGRFALIYLPLHGLHLQARLNSNFRNIDISCALSLFNYFEKPDGTTPRYMSGQHFWEVGMRGFRISQLSSRISLYFDILSCYRNRDWIVSQNFKLRSKSSGK